MALFEIVSYSFTIVETPLSDGGNFTSEGDPLPSVPSVGVCQPITAGAEYGAVYTGINWPADQYSEVTILACGSVSALCPILARFSAPGFAYYFQLSGNNINTVYAIVNGVKHPLGNLSMSQTTGDVIRLTVQTQGNGNLVSVSKNGVLVASFTDHVFASTLASGIPGFALIGPPFNPSGAQISRWAGGGPCQIQAVPTTLSFSGTNPPAQNITIQNIGGGGSVPFTFVSNQPWLLPASGSGNTPGTVSISVNTAGLATGTYVGTVTFNSTCGSPAVVVNVTLNVGAPCAPVDSSGTPVNGVYISELSLYVIPSAALYTQPVPNAAISVNEDASQGRKQLILDFNNNEGLYVRDLGTIFTWPINSSTTLDVWQPSIIPMDDDVYNRLSFHFLMSSFGMVGWGHLREVNLAFASTQDLTLLLTFDQWPGITLVIPNSNGNEIKMKVVIPPNKFKLIEGFLSCPTSFKLWASDVQFKIGQWGRGEQYAVIKPLVG